MNSLKKTVDTGDYRPSIVLSEILIPLTGEIKLNSPGTAMPEISQSRASQFTLALAVEIQNPLANINIAAATLKFAVQDETLKTYIDLIMRSTVRINNLINDFLVCQQANEAVA